MQPSTGCGASSRTQPCSALNAPRPPCRRLAADCCPAHPTRVGTGQSAIHDCSFHFCLREVQQKGHCSIRMALLQSQATKLAGLFCALQSNPCSRFQLFFSCNTFIFVRPSVLNMSASQLHISVSVCLPHFCSCSSNGGISGKRLP